MGNWFSSLLGEDKSSANNKTQPLLNNSTRRNVPNRRNNGVGKTNTNKQKNVQNIPNGNKPIQNIPNAPPQSSTPYKINFIFQRHATSCANLLNKGFGGGKIETQKQVNKYASDSDICNIGVMQCLQVADFLQQSEDYGFDYINGNNIGITKLINSINTNRKINKGKSPVPRQNMAGPSNNGAVPRQNMAGPSLSNNGAGPSSNEAVPSTGGADTITIYCCSELIRTQETLYVSFNRYIKDYFQKNRVIVLPWLNERGFSKYINSDNFTVNYDFTKKSWKRFIENLQTRDNVFINNLGQTKNKKQKLNLNITDPEWDNIFYLSPVIYKNKTSFDKNITIKQKGTVRSIGDPQQLMDYLPKILDQYFEDMGLENKPTKINVVMVSHHNSAEAIINFLYPPLKESFNKQQLMNCEILKLPTISFPFSQQINSNRTENASNLRLFPVGFYDKFVKQKITVYTGMKTYPYYIFYLFRINLFLTVIDIVKQKNFGTSGFGNKTINTTDNPEKIEINNPLVKFLDLPADYYITRLQDLKKILQSYLKFYNSPNLFFNYNFYLKTIQKELNEYNSKITQKLQINQKPNQSYANNRNRLYNKMLLTDINNLYGGTIRDLINNNLRNNRVDSDKMLHNLLFDFCNPNLIITPQQQKVKPFMGKTSIKKIKQESNEI